MNQVRAALSRYLVMALAATLVVFAAGPAQAQDGDYPWCVVNQTDRRIEFYQNNGSIQPVEAGAYKCCTGDRCRRQVNVGLDIGPDEDVELATGLAAFALTKLLRYAGPPGQPIIYDDWLRFCTVDAQYNDRIEVFRTENGWRCDIAGRDGAVRYSLDRDGRTQTPLSYLTVCNQARDGAAHLAYGFYNQSGFISRGWYNIPDGSCSKLPLNYGFRDYVYYHATTDGLTWDGDWNLCVHPSEPFEIAGADKERCGWVYVHYGFADAYARGDTTITLGPSQ